MQKADAAVFNLSLLTSDVYGVLAGKYLFGEALNSLYYVAFGVIVIGLILYNHKPPGYRGRDSPLTKAADASAPLLDFVAVQTDDGDVYGSVQESSTLVLN